MDLYHIVLFVHVLTAIVVVGGSFSLDFMSVMARRSRTVDTMRSWLHAMGIGSKLIARSAGLTLVAALYLAFDGSWWGDAWLLVSLVLFLTAGALAGTVMDKGIAQMTETAEGFPEGPMTPDLGRQLGRPAMALAGPTMIGIDVAIVFLMTNKPGTGGALTAAAVCVAAGAAFGLRERRHLLQPPAPAAPAPGAA